MTRIKTLVTIRTNGFVALDTPLMAEGYTGSGMEFLAKKMKEFNMVPYSSVSVQNDDAPYPLEAGGSVAATLVTGDLRLGAVGTVTYVDGNHMIAFGHPFLDKGSSGYFSTMHTYSPSCQARIFRSNWDPWGLKSA